MKAILSVGAKFPFGVLVFSSLLFFRTPISYAEDVSMTASSRMLLEIKQKLDASENRKIQILANQGKILGEIEKSRKWEFNNARKKKPAPVPAP